MKPRLLFIDLIRSFAILGVVSIHTTHYFVMAADYTHGFSWWLFAIWGTIIRVSVPLFFMASGLLALTQPPISSYKQWVKKTFWRLGLPLLFWFAFFYIWEYLFWGRSHSLSEIINDYFLLQTGPLYFLQDLIILYMIVPALVLFHRTASARAQQILSFILFIYAVGVTLVNYFGVPGSQLNQFNDWTIYLSYFYAGYYFSHHQLKIKSMRLLGVICLLCLTFAVIPIHFNWWGIKGLFWNYLFPTTIILTISSFVAFKHLETFLRSIKHSLLFRIIRQISLASYGIYLIHIFIMDIIERYGHLQIHLVADNLWLMEIKYIALVFIVSFIMTRIIQYLPVIRKTLGQS